jgi:hypothetical protein
MMPRDLARGLVLPICSAVKWKRIFGLSPQTQLTPGLIEKMVK